MTGLREESLTPITIRLEKEEPLAGYLVLLRKPGG
jgi:hypothetical protein